MEYVELLRVRRALVSYVVALAFVFLLIWIVLHGNGAIRLNLRFGNKGMDAEDLLDISGIGALFLATTFAGNLAGESATLPFLWTKPVTRTMLALRFVAIDVLGLAAGIALVAFIVLIVAAGTGNFGGVHFVRANAATAALALGAPLAWYGITLLAASRLGPGSAARAGALLWPVFIVLIFLEFTQLPPAAHTAVIVLEHADPLAYLVVNDKAGAGILAADSLQRAAACWAIALVTITAGIRLWSTRET